MTEEKRKLFILALSSVVVLASLSFLIKRTPENTVEPSNTPTTPKVENIRVILQINNGVDQTSLSAKLAPNNSVYDLMEYFRQKDQIKYELTNYTYGQVVDSINDLANNPASMMYWNLYVNDSLNSTNIKDIKLIKNTYYKWVYEKRI